MKEFDFKLGLDAYHFNGVLLVMSHGIKPLEIIKFCSKRCQWYLLPIIAYFPALGRKLIKK